MRNWFLQLVFDEFNCGFIQNGLDMQYKKPNVSGVSKVFYILGYNYKNFRLQVSYKWFVKREDLL